MQAAVLFVHVVGDELFERVLDVMDMRLVGASGVGSRLELLP